MTLASQMAQEAIRCGRLQPKHKQVNGQVCTILLDHPITDLQGGLV